MPGTRGGSTKLSRRGFAAIDKAFFVDINLTMRICLFALLSLLCVSCNSTQKPKEPAFEIVEIMPRYIEEENFKRISEYLTGKENPGKRVILRTRKQQRDGYYFILVLNKNVRDLPADVYIEGEFYTYKSFDRETHRFELPSIRPKTREVFIGLTGEDWPNKDAIPAAWRFTLKNSRGDILAQKKSYLWNL